MQSSKAKPTSRKAKPTSRKAKPTDLSANDIVSSPPQSQMVDVCNLRPHPRQAELVGDMPPGEFDLLVADVKANGIHTPLIVLADGTIACGHQRYRAAVQLGLEKIPCIVLEHLTDPEDPAVIELLLDDNLRRRHLSKLQQAKCAIKLAEIDCDRQKKTDFWVRKRLIEKAVMSQLADGRQIDQRGRKNAQRYILVANAPQSIQDVYERGLIPLVSAAAVAGLQASVQEKLGKTVAGLLDQIGSKGERTIKERVRQTVRAALDKPKKGKRRAVPTPMEPVDTLTNVLKANLGPVEDNRERIVDYINNAGVLVKTFRMQIADARKDFERGAELFRQIETAIESKPAAADEIDEYEDDDVEPVDIVSSNNAIALTCGS
jgi:hypothetical protein